MIIIDFENYWIKYYISTIDVYEVSVITLHAHDISMIDC